MTDGPTVIPFPVRRRMPHDTGWPIQRKARLILALSVGLWWAIIWAVVWLVV